MWAPTQLGGFCSHTFFWAHRPSFSHRAISQRAFINFPRSKSPLVRGVSIQRVWVPFPPLGFSKQAKQSTRRPFPTFGRLSQFQPRQAPTAGQSHSLWARPISLGPFLAGVSPKGGVFQAKPIKVCSVSKPPQILWGSKTQARQAGIFFAFFHKGLVPTQGVFKRGSHINGGFFIFLFLCGAQTSRKVLPNWANGRTHFPFCLTHRGAFNLARIGTRV